MTATSAIASHPSTALIERAVASLGAFAGLSGCRHLILCDGYVGDDRELSARYELYKKRLRGLAQQGGFCTSVAIIELEEAVGLPGVILHGASRVRTPYLLVFEHDWEIVRPIDTAGIVRTFAQYRGVQNIRLNKRRTTVCGWDTILDPDSMMRAVPLTRTSCWSGTPHFAKMSHYQRVVLPSIRERLGGGTLGYEDPVHLSYVRDIRRVGFDRAQRDWGVFIYGRMGDPPSVLHLDGAHTPGLETIVH
ncbi:MAG: hypothetical protein ACRD2X_05940 [Vicinamibacteraceae bacterium]